MKEFKGKVLFLDRSDINTDEIIPAKYLTENIKEALKPYLMEDLKLEGFDPRNDIDTNSIIITRANFGCGSSREHAPWALEVNGYNVVIAQSFARIFQQNMFNCGMAAIELPRKTIDHIFDNYSSNVTNIEIDIKNCIISIESEATKEQIKFEISEFDQELIFAGGWVEYADSNY
ncbi:MAG: 3-isopropylmalate dehydratase small subunit [Desulfobacteraceae bacterium]|nr:3-isopropylmalate dehydratase small subunit [Desulfobacteraceae bacterium]